MKKLAVVGGGVFSWSFLWQLSQSHHHIPLEITLLDGSQYYPPCSLSSTALVARRAQGFGISPLGDLIQDSWQWWCHQFQVHHWTEKQGVTLSPLYYNQQAHLKRTQYLEQLNSVRFSPSENLVKVEPSFLINPHLWLEYLQEQTKKNFHNQGITFNHQFAKVTAINSQNNEVIVNQEIYHFDYLVVQPGAYQISNLEIVEKEEVIFGSYLEFSNVIQNFKTSFSFSSHYQLYYQKFEQILKLGIYSSKETSDLEEWNQLQSLYLLALQEGWSLPPLETATKKIGLRHKLKKRLPVIGRINNCFYHLGGYKIGYLVSLFQSRQLINLLYKNLQ